MRAPETDPNEQVADADLVLRSRSGDADAFGELWRRHYGSAIVAARSITTSFDADDLVQESYAKIFQAIRRGGGPTGSFRAYLFTAIRNTAAAWGGSRRETAVDELAEFEDPATSEEAVDAALDRSLTTTAFRSLPSRWQEVLWYTEVEQMKPAEVAPLLGMKASAVSQLAFRAREGLREAWIQAHIAAVGEGTECSWTIERLGAHERGNLGARDQGRLDRHVADCARCAIVAAEAHDVGSRLVLVLLPLAVGVTGAAGYLASIQGSASTQVALMAMPEQILEGPAAASGHLIGYGPELFGHVVEGGAALIGAVGAGLAGVAGSSTAASGSAGGASAGGGAWAIGGIIAASVASLSIAGAVVAATVLPVIGGAPTSGAAAFDDGTAPADASIEPDPELAAHQPEETTQPEAPAPEPTPEEPSPEPTVEPESPAPTVTQEAAGGAAPTPEPEPTADPTPTPSESPEPTPSPEPTEPAPEPTDPVPEPTEPAPEPAAPRLTLDVEASRWIATADPRDPIHVVVNTKPGEAVTVRIAGLLVSTSKTVIADKDGVACAEFVEADWMTAWSSLELSDSDEHVQRTLGDIRR